MAGAISRRIPAVSSLLINKLLFLELSCTQLLTSYHADISLINKQYRIRATSCIKTKYVMHTEYSVSRKLLLKAENIEEGALSKRECAYSRQGKIQNR